MGRRHPQGPRPIKDADKELAAARQNRDALGRLRAQLKKANAQHEAARRAVLAALAACENTYAEVALWSERIERAEEKLEGDKS